MKKSTILITFLMLMTIGTFCSCSSNDNKEVQNILETDNIDEIFVYHGSQWMGLRLDSDLASGITDKMDSFLKSPSNFMGSTDGEMYIKKLDAELTDLSDSDYVLVITLKMQWILHSPMMSIRRMLMNPHLLYMDFVIW